MLFAAARRAENIFGSTVIWAGDEKELKGRQSAANAGNRFFCIHIMIKSWPAVRCLKSESENTDSEAAGDKLYMSGTVFQRTGCGHAEVPYDQIEEYRRFQRPEKIVGYTRTWTAVTEKNQKPD